MNIRYEILRLWRFCFVVTAAFLKYNNCAPQVHKALTEEVKDCCVLLISNKMSVVEKASHIVVLDEGAVKEEGVHPELMRNGSLYARLVEMQNKSCFRKEDGSNETA